MAMLPNYYYFVPKVKWMDEGAVVTLEDHSDADVVEVVRCRECVFREDDGECTGPLAEATMPPEWFCASGQRREGKHNETD